MVKSFGLEEIKKLFAYYIIGEKQPDMIIVDVKKGDHKIVFFEKSKGFDQAITPDVNRKKGGYYMKKVGDSINPCYPVIVDMYEYKNLVSADGKPTDVWVGTPEEIDLQILLSLKKEGKWKVYYL